MVITRGRAFFHRSAPEGETMNACTLQKRLVPTTRMAF